MNDGVAEHHPDPIVRWRHRRMMAYIALAGGLLYPFLILAVPADKAEFLEGIAWLFYFFTGSVVGGYIGSSVWETVKITAATSRSK